MENDFELEQVSVRLVKDSPLYSDERIITAESAVKIIGKELMTQLDREQLCIVNLNSFGQPINFSIVSVGQIDQALVNPREMLKASILSNAANAIVIHNHRRTGMLTT
ncbi:MAG: JAB domain-containing protein [Eubacterium ventriosum]